VTRSDRRSLGIALVASLFLLAPGFGAGSSGAVGIGPSHPVVPGPLSTAIHSPSDPAPASESLPAAPPSANLKYMPSPDGSAWIAQRALRASESGGVPAYDAFVPRPSATSAQIAAAASAGHIAPLYGGDDPAPMGIADYGLTAGTGGRVIPTSVNTDRIAGTFNTDGPGIQPLYLTAAAPDGYSVDLAATSSDVALFGDSDYTFWFEDAAEYFVRSHQLVFVANVWNFSSGVIPPSTFYDLESGSEVGFSYVVSTFDVPSSVSGPLAISLWINSTATGGRDAVSFAAGVSTPAYNTTQTFETVVFNSTSPSVPSVSPANLTADGSRYNPVGLTDDFELVLGGPGGGAQTNVYLANATLRLDIWNEASGSYQPVPSAYSYGGDAAETASGVCVGWQNSGGDQAILSEGPSILRGLWNATGLPGLDPVNVSVNVPNAFLFFTTEGSSNFSQGGSTYWAPDERTTDYAVPPGLYNLTALMSDFTPATLAGVSVPLGIPATLVIDLTANASEGIYAPLWAWNNGTLARISSAGVGTPSDPYRIINDQHMDIGSLFGLFNDLTFPVFAGVFLNDTHASVQLSQMPALTVRSPYSSTPAVNDLTYQIYDSTDVVLVDSAHVSGWFTDLLAGEYPRWATDSVVLWNSSDDLIANTTFATQTAGAYLYGGTNNTIWGNTFTMVPAPRFPTSGLYLLNLSFGLEEGESGDLVYDNVFDTTITAVTPLGDLYNGTYFVPADQWNISRQSASNVRTLDGVNLTGSVIGGSYQGGNYWWDYGTPANPYGELPYTAAGNLAVGGDEVPLVTGNLTGVILAEIGLTGGTTWTANVYGATTDVLLYSLVVNTPNVTVLLPENGSYAVLASAGALGASVTFSVASARTVNLDFGASYSATFEESGLPAGVAWGIHVDYRTVEVTGTPLTVALLNGTWPFSVQAPVGFTSVPVSGYAHITGGNVTIPIEFQPILYIVTFTPSGLANGTEWYVSIAGELLNTSAPASLQLSLANGSYSASFNASGYSVTPASTEIEVFGGPVSVLVAFTAVPTYTVTFAESGLLVGTPWSITVHGVSTETSPNGSIAFRLPADAPPYSWDAGAVPGYSAHPPNGTLHVFDHPLTINVTFVALPAYSVTFTEGGLATGTAWSVNLSVGVGSGTGSTIQFHLPAGPYSFSIPVVPGYASHPNGGRFNVTTTPLNFAIQFTPVTPGIYVVTFSETGLPPATNWSVSLGAAIESSTGSTITFAAGNGSYPWTTLHVVGYNSQPSAGTLTITGQDAAVSVVFVTATPPASYALTFVEAGLPLGTNWSVTLDGTQEDTTGVSIVFIELNASYDYSIGPVPGYSANDSTGRVTVGGSPTTVVVGFSANPAADQFLGVSYPLWSLVLAALAVLTLDLALLLRKRARRQGPASRPPPPQRPGR